MKYTIVRMFPEAERRGLKVGDEFEPSNRESAGALMRANLLQAHPDGYKRKPAPKAAVSVRSTGGFDRQKALAAAPRNKDAASQRRVK